MASRAIVRVQIADAERAADLATAHEIAQAYPGWAVWSSRDGVTRVATRTGNQRPPDGDDPVWARTLLADSWTDLRAQLAEQAQADAMRTYEVTA